MTLGDKLKMTGEKVKDKLTPGSRKDDVDYNTAGAYGTAGATDTGAGTHQGLGQKLGQKLRRKGSGSSSSSSSDNEADRRERHGEVLGAERFVQHEDRPVLKERTHEVMEHHPVEKRYVQETRFEGERPIGGAREEVVGVTERVVGGAGHHHHHTGQGEYNTAAATGVAGTTDVDRMGYDNREGYAGRGTY